MPDAALARLNAALDGRYRIECQLGEGGMATLYLADDLRHDRKVARSRCSESSTSWTGRVALRPQVFVGSGVELDPPGREAAPFNLAMVYVGLDP